MPAQFSFGSHMFLKLKVWLVYKTTSGGTEGSEKNGGKHFLVMSDPVGSWECHCVGVDIQKSPQLCCLGAGVLLSQQSWWVTTGPGDREKALWMDQHGKESGRNWQPGGWRWAKDTKRYRASRRWEWIEKRFSRPKAVSKTIFTVLQAKFKRAMHGLGTINKYLFVFVFMLLY